MNTQINETATPALAPSLLEIPLDLIRESATNPRRQFDTAALAELADNIRVHGVLQPVLVRPAPDTPDRYELVAGARRYRASKLAEKKTIPAALRDFTDTECREIQLIENLQREGVHELDEAEGYAALRNIQPDVYTVEVIAQKVGKSAKYVCGRLKLTSLTAEARQAFHSGKLTSGHAFEIARLQESDQKRALEECFPDHRSVSAALKDKRAEATTVRQLRQWIEREIHLDLKNAPFDILDEGLLPAAGTCAKCPKRTGANPLLFAEIREKSICTDRACYHAKVEALVQIRTEPLEKEGQEVLRVSSFPAWHSGKQAADVLHQGDFHMAQQKDECATTQPAVWVDGKHAGSILYICTGMTCKVHASVSRFLPSPEEKAKRAKERLAERVEKQTRVRLLEAVRAKLPNKLSRPDFETAVLDYFRRLGHDNHRRLLKLYGWEERKTKSSWGAQIVDYEKIAASAVRVMKSEELNRFLVVCSLASDLCCPSYNPGQSLSKDSNLATVARRYKLDVAAVASAVRSELVKKGANGKGSKKAKASHKN